MPVKFSYDPQFGLQIEAELDSELSREEAMIVAVRDLASGMNSLSHAVWDLYEEFRLKQFYKRDEPSPPRAPAPVKKPTAATRKKASGAASKKRRK